MAFIRRYAAQGDPIPRTFMRAGHIALPRQFVRPRVGPGMTHANRFTIPSHPNGFMRRDLLAGDPFLGKLFKKAGKALKKVTLKGVVKGVANVAKIGASLVPGVGGIVASALANRAAPEPAAPEIVYSEPAQPALDMEQLRSMIQAIMLEQAQAEAAAHQAAAVQQYQMLAAQRVPSFYYGGF